MESANIATDKKRYKAAVACADSYYVVCPYKGCGHSNTLNTAQKGQIARCTNCRKEYKIRKVVAR